jgi:hypothetical protein
MIRLLDLPAGPFSLKPVPVSSEFGKVHSRIYGYVHPLASIFITRCRFRIINFLSFCTIVQECKTTLTKLNYLTNFGNC